MKSHYFLIFILIALGAITGSTLATITYLNNRKATPNLPSTLPAIVNNSREISSPDLATSTPSPESLSTQSKPGNFLQFRSLLLDSIKQRDGNFIRAIVTPDTQWSFGGSINLATYNIDDSKSPFWQAIEKAVAAGCTVEPNAIVPGQEPGSEVWVCPQTSGKPIYNFGWLEEVAILREKVNVRAKPGTNASIVGSAVQEIVKFDLETFNNLSSDEQRSVNCPNGWTPVILSNGKQGWIQNNFVYYEPRDYRASFIRSNGKWELRYFLQGDGN